MSEIQTMTAEQLSQAYQAKTLSPVEVTRDVLARSHAADATLNAFTLIDDAGALAQAQASQDRWHKGAPLSPFDGVPTTIKDLLAHKTWPTTFGSHVLKSAISDTDAPAVARLKEAGCVLFAMTTTPEMGWKGVTDSPRYGISRNPWNPDRTPGGSSGGAAISAALNLGCFHIGTDGGGSIRMPAAFTGIFGIKASFGRVPAYPASVMGTVAHIGPMTRTVADGTHMLNIISGADKRDWYAAPPQPPITADQISGTSLEGMRIAYSPDLGYMTVDPEVATAVRKSVEVLADLGAEIEEIPPLFDNPKHIFETLWFAAARHKLDTLPPDQMAQIDAGLLASAEQGAQVHTADYLDALLARADLGVKAEVFMQDWDALVTPTLPFTAFAAGQETPSGTGRWTDWAGFNYPFNLTQQPSCTVPCGFDSSGLPIGMQITSAKFQDARALRIAAAFEGSRPNVFPV